MKVKRIHNGWSRGLGAHALCGGSQIKREVIIVNLFNEKKRIRRNDGVTDFKSNEYEKRKEYAAEYGYSHDSSIDDRYQVILYHYCLDCSGFLLGFYVIKNE